MRCSRASRSACRCCPKSFRLCGGLCQGVADCRESAAAVAAAAFDNGAEGGVGLGAPLGAESVGHFAEDHRRPQCPLAFVVCRLGVAALQEHEQLVAAVEIHCVSQLAALGIGRLACEQPLQLPFETAAMRRNGGAGEIGPAAADRTRVLEQRLEVGREDRIAVVDGYCASRIRCARQNWCASARLNCAGSRSDSHIFGFTPARKSVGTHFPRVGAIT
jgi:hypothetical protein